MKELDLQDFKKARGTIKKVCNKSDGENYDSRYSVI